MMLVATFSVREKWKIPQESENMALGNKPAWEAAKEVHDKFSMEYKHRGEAVENITGIFGPWFIIPWIAFSFVTTIKPHDVLLPWWEGSEKTASDWSRTYYLLYHVTQFYLLLSQYMCGLKMNDYHYNFYRIMRRKQLAAYDDPDYRAYACQLHIDYEKAYNFSPRILKINLKTSMDNPLYVFLLLIAIFLGTSKNLTQ